VVVVQSVILTSISSRPLISPPALLLGMHACDLCGKEYTRADNLRRHMGKVHQKSGDHEEKSITMNELESEEDISTDSSYTEDETDDPWDSAVNMAFKECEHLFEKKSEKTKRRSHNRHGPKKTGL